MEVGLNKSISTLSRFDNGCKLFAPNRLSGVIIFGLATVCLLIATLFTSACESDPILAPQDDNGKEPGSYAFVSFSKQGSDPPEDRSSNYNPEIF